MTTDEELDRAHELDSLLGTVAEAMRAEVLLVDPDTPADVAVRRLEREGISGAPVVRHGHVIGVVTLRDLFAAVGHHEAAQTTGPFLRHEVGILTRDDILRAVAAAADQRVHQDRYPRLLPD